MTAIAELIERLEDEDLFPDDSDYYMVRIEPDEMILIIAALRARQAGGGDE